MNKIENPFLIYGYEGPEYFCDRQQETEDLITALRNGCNLTLLSPRRYGKTGLIRNAFHHIQEQNSDVVCFYVDIYATKTFYDFVALLGKAVIGKLDTPIQRAEGFITKIFRSSQITMSPDMLTGMPSLGLSFVPQFAKETLEDIFTYIEQSGKKCYIAIDEFQQISEYPETNVEELLRTHVQNTHNVHFIFAGSKQHMMAEMFDSPKHPFYRSTERMNLQLLNEHVYYDFAIDKLKDKGVTLPMETFHMLYSLVDGVTWYVQAILNRLYRLGDCIVTEDVIMQVIGKIIESEEDNFKRQCHMLTAAQLRLLTAIAKERIVKEPLSGRFLHAHSIKSASTVQRALDYLLREEYVYHGDEGYVVYDRFLGMWLRFC